jgi:hypothetical protein
MKFILKSVCLFLDSNLETSSARTKPYFYMTAVGKDNVSIPLVFLFHQEGDRLLSALTAKPNLIVYMTNNFKGKIKRNCNFHLSKQQVFIDPVG